jgi:hypothetical protein
MQPLLTAGHATYRRTCIAWRKPIDENGQTFPGSHRTVPGDF